MIIRWNDQRFVFSRHVVYLYEDIFTYVIGTEGVPGPVGGPVGPLLTLF